PATAATVSAAAVPDAASGAPVNLREFIKQSGVLPLLRGAKKKRARMFRPPKPVFRKLRVFGVDPDVASRFETALLNEITLRVAWEDLRPGPCGEYIHVIDINGHGARVSPPLDLNHADLLAQDGLPASDGNPAFRQQMLYAVTMRTIQNFQQALGRTI